jgi:putative tricarboxylic transport membrane protein
LLRNFWRGLIIAVVAGFAAAALAQGDLRITAPSSPGSGWDQIARFLKSGLLEAGVSQSVEIANAPGAGGTTGLAAFVTGARGDGAQLLVTGFAMVGASLVNKTPAGLDAVTPIARLTGEYLAIVVSADSPIKTVQDLGAAMQADAALMTWAGGPTGSVDHVAAALFASAIGVDPSRIAYVAFFNSAEATAALLEGKVAVGVAPSGELEDAVKAGKLRALAVTGPKRIEGIDAPTLKEAGIAFEIGNWRGVVAAPDITPEQRSALIEAVGAATRSPVWVEAIRQKGWEDAYLAGEAFGTFLKDEQTRVASVLRCLGLVR